MAIIKCKMCGGDILLEEGKTVATCEYCGTTQTVPSADNEKKLAMFSRANRHRIECDFDKAAGVYESIVADFPEEAEAYWGLLLCKFGIEYVDDPATGKKIPTCHRSSYENVMDDPDFDQVMDNSDPLARGLYREEARALEQLRQDILEISAKEAPYDVFICYKETDEKGERTVDSVIAQDIYDTLTDRGYRVFFSRITLEDKLGQEYEPYIFAALNSAKVMLAVGTDYEHYNAVWVKNEWSRYLKLMAKDRKKVLIPCYKGIDAYDMPKEFRALQAQDMGKIGAMQDLLRGLEKILTVHEKTVTAAPAGIQADDVDKLITFKNAVEQGEKNTIPALQEALKKLRPLSGWNHADEKISEFEKKLAALKKAKKRKRMIILLSLCAFVLAIFLAVFTVKTHRRKVHYQWGQLYSSQYLYCRAEREFQDAKNYRDADELEKEAGEQHSKVLEQYEKLTQGGTYADYESDDGTTLHLHQTWEQTFSIDGTFNADGLFSWDEETGEYLFIDGSQVGYESIRDPVICDAPVRYRGILLENGALQLTGSDGSVILLNYVGNDTGIPPTTIAATEALSEDDALKLELRAMLEDAYSKYSGDFDIDEGNTADPDYLAFKYVLPILQGEDWDAKYDLITSGKLYRLINDGTICNEEMMCFLGENIYPLLTEFGVEQTVQEDCLLLWAAIMVYGNN